MLRSPNVSRSSPVSLGAAPLAPAGLRREAHVAAAASCVRCFGPAAAGGCHRLEEAPGSGGAGARFPPAGSGRPEGAATGQVDILKKMFLKPFTYPLPETRFLHAGKSVYKLKIRYGNSLSSDNIDNNESTAKELEEAIRVIIGNLDNLHPFATEHLTIFPYLSKWERVSKLRFKHGDTFLSPYPHVCTMYVELNSFQPSIFVGKEVNMDACNAVQDRIEMIENVETEVTVKWRKMEDPAEISYAKPCLDRTETENIHTGSKSNDDFRTQPRTALCTERDTTGYWLSEEETPFTHPSPNQSEEIQQKYNNPAALRKDYSHMSLWEPVVYNIEQGTETTQKEGKMQLQPQIIPTRPQENVESKRGGFLELLKSTLFPPLQRVLGGNI
ncbi:membrane-anchored junction protein isoform X2 [Pelodiscus sinensis]|uniref:membrane-anchored junction protein isoform X2 n=1 Tax=Pelodiscus sinensis TaxID=13735 RepID=UPI003F6A5641